MLIQTPLNECGGGSGLSRFVLVVVELDSNWTRKYFLRPTRRAGLLIVLFVITRISRSLEQADAVMLQSTCGDAEITAKLNTTI